MVSQKVRDIMTTQVITLSENDTLKEAVAKFALDNISGAPVIDDSYRMIGMISETDILNFVLKTSKMHGLDGKVVFDSKNPAAMEFKDFLKDEFKNTTVGHIMCRTVMSASPSTDISELLVKMMDKDINRLPVLERGVLVGIVTRGDIIFFMHKNKI